MQQDGSSRQVNWNVNGVHTFRASQGSVQFRSSAGIQFETRRLHVNRITTKNLVPGQENVDRGTNTFVSENLTRERTMALYGQEELQLFDDRLLVAFGARAERSSANGNTDKYYLFPKVSTSYRLVGLAGTGSELKFRAAYGETGNQPLFGQKFTLLDVPILGSQTSFVPGVFAGANTIRPERLREVEGGVDLSVWGGRASLEVTAYNRNTTDLLLVRVPAPSSGFASEAINGGKLRNRGIEIAAGVTPIQKRNLSWLVRTTFILNRGIVVDIGMDQGRNGGAKRRIREGECGGIREDERLSDGTRPLPGDD